MRCHQMMTPLKRTTSLPAEHLPRQAAGGEGQLQGGGLVGDRGETLGLPIATLMIRPDGW